MRTALLKIRKMSINVVDIYLVKCYNKNTTYRRTAAEYIRETSQEKLRGDLKGET